MRYLKPLLTHFATASNAGRLPAPCEPARLPTALFSSRKQHQTTPKTSFFFFKYRITREKPPYEDTNLWPLKPKQETSLKDETTIKHQPHRSVSNFQAAWRLQRMRRAKLANRVRLRRGSGCRLSKCFDVFCFLIKSQNRSYLSTHEIYHAFPWFSYIFICLRYGQNNP